MKTFMLITLAGVLAVMAVSTFGASASLNLGFNYSWLIPLSCLIYGTLGFAVSKHVGWLYVPVAAAIVGLVESTAGWYVSWKIGPGDPRVPITEVMVAVTVVFVVLQGMIVAMIGGTVALAFRSNESVA